MLTVKQTRPVAVFAFLALAWLLISGTDAASVSSTNGTAQVCDASTDVRQLLAAPFSTNVDAEQRLSCLQEVFLQTWDPKGIFLGTYLQVTKQMNAKIAEGYFEDNEWVALYLRNFADYYRVRVLQYLNGDPALPTPWRIAFTEISTHDLILQTLLLGMNAHISYDLPLAIAESGTSPNTRSKARDNYKVNSVLDESYGNAISVVTKHYSSVLANASVDLLKLDDLAFAIYLRVARQGSWDSARVLELTRPGGLIYNALLLALDKAVTVLADFVIALSLDRNLYALLQALEGSNKLRCFCEWLPELC